MSLKVWLSVALTACMLPRPCSQEVTSSRPWPRVGPEEVFSPEERAKIGWWQTAPSVGLRRRPAEALNVPIKLNFMGIVQAVLRVDKESPDSQEFWNTCQLSTNTHSTADIKGALWESKGATVVRSRRVDTAVFILDSSCTIWQLILADNLHPEAQKVDVLEPSLCTDIPRSLDYAFEVKVFRHLKLLDDTFAVDREGQTILDNNSHTILANISWLGHFISTKDRLVDDYSNSTACLLCTDQLYPVTWDLRKQAELFARRSDSPKGLLALQNGTLLFINLKYQDSQPKVSKLITGLEGQIDSVEIHDDLLLISTRNRVHNQTTYHLYSLKNSEETSRDQSLELKLEIVSATIEKEGALIAVDSYQRKLLIADEVAVAQLGLSFEGKTGPNLKNLTNLYSNFSFQVLGVEGRKIMISSSAVHELDKTIGETLIAINCPPLKQNELPKDEHYTLNLTLKHCPEQLAQNLSFDSWCHLSIPIILRTDDQSEVFSKSVLLILMLVLLLTALVLAAFLARSRQDAQNSKLMAEIAQIELDTLKLTAEYANKMKPPTSKDFDDIGETDFEPYQEN
jgi:hypothetical protein